MDKLSTIQITIWVTAFDYWTTVTIVRCPVSKWSGIHMAWIRYSGVWYLDGYCIQIPTVFGLVWRVLAQDESYFLLRKTAEITWRLILDLCTLALIFEHVPSCLNGKNITPSQKNYHLYKREDRLGKALWRRKLPCLERKLQIWNEKYNFVYCVLLN